MIPELPKVEFNPEDLKSREEAKNGVEQEYERAESSSGGVEKPADLSRAGSVGVEAGLTSFETSAPGGQTGSPAGQASSDDDDSDSLAEVSGQRQAERGTTPPNAAINTPRTAEDRDDIEREWIDKAKKIVDQTKSDPFLQERSVSRLQADYLKKRFNKDVKLPPEDL